MALFKKNKDERTACLAFKIAITDEVVARWTYMYYYIKEAPAGEVLAAQLGGRALRQTMQVYHV
jgi:hypothetical protein